MEYWYLWLILAVLIVAFIFGSFKASESSKKRRAQMKKQMEYFDHLKMLKKDYKDFDCEKIEQYDNQTLLEGVAFYVQSFLETFDDIQMKKEFEKLNTPLKYIYTVNYLFEDSAEGGLRQFFQLNGNQLCSLVCPAVDEIFENEELSAVVKKEWEMFDEDSDVSIDYEKIDSLDEEFKNITEKLDFKKIGADYAIKSKNFLKIISE
ncbi:MAG: DMP19 family protein [Clostridiales bacterium]|nr:DMP19 family protein [Clostridiales bacterium]